MAMRYIGDAVIEIYYDDALDEYHGTISVPSKNAKWRFDGLRAPRIGFNFASDSSEAYDRMAVSAVAFGSYYTTHNRGDDVPEWAPAPEIADAIEEAVSWASDEKGQGKYEVRRAKDGKGCYVG